MSFCSIEDSRGEREVKATDFPLAVGGLDADLLLPGVPDGEPIAVLGVDGDEIFVQPSDGARVICNGAALEASRWLQPGDILRFERDRIRVEGRPEALRLRVDSGRAPQEIKRPPRPPKTATGGTIRPMDFEPSPMRMGEARRRPRFGSIGITLLIAVILAAGGLLFASRSVEIEISPEPDRQELEGGILQPRLAGRYLLLPGKWVVQASKEGYRDLTQGFEVGPDASQRFRFELQELPGRLAISVPGVDQVSLWVDGELRGPLPPEIELAAGVHELALRAPRYRDAVERLTIEGKGQLQSLEIEMVPGWAAVSFQSDPAGAEVWVDGSAIGTTPLTAELSAGFREIELRQPGYRSHRSTLEVLPAENQQVPVVALRVAPGRLSIKSSPSAANVTVDGVFQGATPLELELAPGQAHELTLSRSGFETTVQEVTLQADEERSLRVDLEARLGEIELRTWPRDAELLLNGEPLTSTAETLFLPSVPQTFELRKQGYVTETRQITPVPGLRQTLEMTLETEQAKTDREWPLLLEVSEGHELRRLEGGKFRMGAPRREPGRRANEAFREVELTRRFYLATREVTNQQFRRFRSGHRSGAIGDQNLEIDHHPVVRVSWQDAAAYCNWLSEKDGLPAFYQRVSGQWVAPEVPTIGYRLPTEAEWVWAARYPRGRQGQKYPWGDELPVPAGSGNYGDQAAAGLLPSSIPSYRDGHATTSPTDAFAADDRGFFDLDGNVAEWMQDHYGVSSTFGRAAEKDPMGPPRGDFHVIRGSSWMHDSVTELRWSYRDYGEEPRPDLGFRIARYVQ